VTDWHLVWLGTLAISALVLALIQIGLMVAALLVARQAAKAIKETRQEIRPLMEKVNRIADDAQRATALALAQVERIDHVMASTTQRIDEAFSTLGAIFGPLKKGGALLAALRAALSVFGDRPARGRQGRDDEDALFIG